MSADLIARGVAARLKAFRDAYQRIPVALGVMSQSVELGAVRDEERAAYPLAFQSVRNRAMATPIAPAKGRMARGGFWCAVYDDLWDHGYDLRIVNGGAGGLSFVTGAAGQVGYRQNSFGYAQMRAAQGGDRGYFGDVIASPLNDGSLWRCTTGRSTAAFGDGPFKVNGAETNLDYVETIGTQSTAASAPTFPTPTLGATVTDGTIVWTCIATSGYSGGQVLSEDANKGFGFDPYGLLARLHEEMGRITGVTRRIVYLSNGQSDQARGATTYGAALQSIASYFLTRGYEVMIGLTTFYPRSTTANYDALQTGRTNALAALRAGSHAARVLDGANLYALMGSTGPMGGWRGTGAISGGVLNVTASIGARSPAPGQQIVLDGSTNGTVVATIASLGSYDPATGTGTINVSGADRASTGLIAMGDYYDLKDQTHLNARGNVGPALGGVQPIRRHVADALKLALPRVTV